MLRDEKRVFTIPPGPRFLRSLAESLLNGRLVPGFVYNTGSPQDLADATIYVPTRRAARVLRSEFTSLLGRRSAILPVIRPLGETDDDSGFFDAALPETLDLLEPLGAIPAALELARLIEAWREKLPEAVVSIHGGAPVIAPASPSDAIWLAKELMDLISEVETAEIDWKGLDALEAAEYAEWWQLTLEFLKIARDYWPARLHELHASSPARHRNAVLAAEAKRMASAAHKGPVILAGSTGSLPATARLIDIVARLEQGAVVLPGLDLQMPDDHWKCLDMGGSSKTPDPTLCTHPQFGLHSLLQQLRVKRAQVFSLCEPSEEISIRSRAISLALSPSQTTDQWPALKAAFDQTALKNAFSNISLIEAANERAEATAIAVALKLALDDAGSKDAQVALVTPDRRLARRVANELLRFGIEADDSAGTPLHATPQGILLRLLLEACLHPGDPVAVVSLLKHPLVHLGFSKDDLNRAVRLLEIHGLRGGIGAVDISTLEDLVAEQLAQHRGAPHAPAWRTPISADDNELLFRLARRIAEAVEPLVGPLLGKKTSTGYSGALTTGQWAERAGQALEFFAAEEDGSLSALWTDEAGEALANLLTGAIEAPAGLDVTGPEWVGVVEALAAGSSIKPKAMSHPQVFIWGTQEARLQHVDAIVIGGLNEGVWPQQANTNPFFSRAMKMAFGLEPPERRAGQIAHDFQMACGTEKVIFSRSLRSGNAPSVASRFLQRILAFTGPETAQELRARGKAYVAIGEMIDDGERQQPASRPEPKPDSHLIPNRYSFSEAGKLRRDPYAVYARRILRLDVVDPFNTDPGPAERGTLYHAILERFVREGHDPGGQDALNIIRGIMDEAFEDQKLPPHIAATWRPRFEDTARAFLAWDVERARSVRKSVTEARARMPLPDGFEMTGFADRIDIGETGFADIIDYKTGSSPSLKQARTLLDPQLSLEAAALRAGAFASTGPQRVGDLLYVRLRPGEKFDVDKVNGDPDNKRSKTPLKPSDQLADDALREFHKLLLLLKSGKRGFLSRVIPETSDIGGDYDHLARTAEWSTADGDGEGDSDA